MLQAMTAARSILAPKGAPGVFHCVSRCVRRAWLCGEDRDSGRSFEHRRAWVESRIGELGDIFAVAIWGFAVMSNHLHVVVELLPEIVAAWSDDEIAARWTRLYRRRDQDASARSEALAGNADRMQVMRERLSNLSWFMRCLSEPIARRANREDGCKGHFWEARFKSQALLDEPAVLAAMTYVDLNPVRANISDGIADSTHTSAHKRLQQLDVAPDCADKQMAPIAGQISRALGISVGDYLALVDRTGRRIHSGKRGVVDGPLPLALRQLGYSEQTWTRQVQGVGSAYPRAIGAAEALLDKATEIGQRWLRGIGMARQLTLRSA